MNLAQYVEQQKGPAVRTLKELIRIKSDAGDPVTSASGEFFPFGQGVQDAFAYMLSKAEEYGFRTEDIDHYGGHIDFGEGEETLGVVGHLDVVPALGEWDFDPYGGEEKDGFITGRGTTDDKGPVVAAFYAMKALKDAGYEPKRRIRLILGLDEETNWKGMDYYLERVKAPDFGITPDGDFPVINGEKGLCDLEIAKKLSKSPAKGLQLSRLSGGTARNIVPDAARAVVKSDFKETYDHIRNELAEYREETGYRLKAKGVGQALEITAEGKACHGASPQDGLNAISVLFGFLGRLNFASDDINEFIEFYNHHIGFQCSGEGMNIGFEDEASGKLTMNNGIVTYDQESIAIELNVRYPVTVDVEQLYQAIMPILDRYNLGLVKNGNQNPLYFPPDSPLITTLMDIYRTKTGDTEHGPMVIGGGTYAKACPNMVAFGGLFPGDPDIMHQRNEKIAADRFFQMIDIYTETLYRLSSEDFSLK